MKCDEARERIASAPAGAPPADAADHARVCEACRTFARRDEAVRRLLALKRREQPDAFFETRLLARVREGIAGTSPAGRWLPGWLSGRLAPTAAWAAAAVVLVVLAVQRAYPPGGPGPAGAPAVADQPAPAAPAVFGPAPAARPIEYVSAPLAPTNPGTGGIRYGPGPTTPVRYDY